MFILNKSIRFIVIFLIGTLLGVILGLALGIKLTNDKHSSTIVEKETILERISSQSFLVTKNVLTTQNVKITVDEGSSWSNFWWGHEITASALVDTGIGVDLKKITSDDITVDKNKKTITINLPESEIYQTNLSGDIEVRTESGILKILFDSDTNEDYNLALSELNSQAENAVSGNDEIMTEARTEAVNSLKMLFSDTDYTLLLAD